MQILITYNIYDNIMYSTVQKKLRHLFSKDALNWRKIDALNQTWCSYSSKNLVLLESHIRMILKNDDFEDFFCALHQSLMKLMSHTMQLDLFLFTLRWTFQKLVFFVFVLFFLCLMHCARFRLLLIFIASPKYNKFMYCVHSCAVIAKENTLKWSLIMI